MASLLEDIIATKAASPQLLSLFKDPRAYTALIVDEPARYFYEESDQENWDQREEFRNVAPPFERMWLEFRAPRFIRSEVYGTIPWDASAWQRAGALLTAYEDHPNKQFFRNAKWVVEAEIFVDQEEMLRTLMARSLYENALRIISQQFGRVSEDLAAEEAERAAQREMAKVPKIMHLVQFVYGVEEDGTFALRESGAGAFLVNQSETSTKWFNLVPAGMQLIANGVTPIFDIALLSVYFMHAAGTELKTKHVPPKLRKAREKKKGVQLPEVRFKVLDLGLGMRQSLKQAKEEGKGLSRALHMRRGHFKKFTKPMFGRPGGKTGDVWVRPHLAGDKEKGEIIKKYRVKKPKEGEQPPGQSRYNPDSLIQDAMAGAYRSYGPIPSRQRAPIDRDELLARLIEAYQVSDDPEERSAVMSRIKRLSGVRSNPDEPYCTCDD